MIVITNWQDLDWKKIREDVLLKQTEIYKAASNGNKELVAALQYDLINDSANKLLSTRRVTQDNRGKRTPGVDGISFIDPKDRIDFAYSLHISGTCSPIRRIYVPKPNGEKRPLGIPTIEDRAKQAIVKSAVEPEWEAKFESASFGFRPGRAATHAQKDVFGALDRMEKFVLDADIRKCFDRINHEALLNKLDNDPIIKNQIKSWLQAGFHDEFYNVRVEENLAGTPQGGIISPLLCNIALNGIREAGYNAVLKFKGTSSFTTQQLQRAYSLIRYADDFIAVHPKLDVMLEIKEEISKFLKPLDLELHPDKTRIVHSSMEHDGHKPGFTFLSVHFEHLITRKHRRMKAIPKTKKNITPKSEKYYNFVLRTSPDTKAIDKHLEELRTSIRKSRGFTQTELIKFLNPKIRGWMNYFMGVRHSDAASYCDNRLFWFLYKWALRRHPTKSKTWVSQKYFHDEVKEDDQKKGQYRTRKWVFGIMQRGYFQLKLKYHYEVGLNVKKYSLAGDFSPYNPKYYQKRLEHFQSQFKQKLYNRQNGLCRVCGGQLLFDDLLEVHHLIQMDIPERDQLSMMWLIHNHCHDNIHRLHGSSAVIEEEPDDG